MTNTRCTFPLASPALIGSLAVLLAFGPFGIATAADPLSLIPADAPLVLGFRDLGASGKKLDEFLRKYDAGFSGVDLDEVQRGFHLADGVVDPSAPVFLVLTRPELEESAFVLVFTPRDAAEFSARLAGHENASQRCEGSDGSYWLAMRGEVAFVSLDPRALRLIKRTPVDRSLAAVMDQQQKAIFASSDVFAYLPLDKWRNRIQPFIFLATNMIKFSALAEQKPLPEGSLALFEWLAGGVQSLMGQMESVTLALDFDGRTFGLTHHHAFVRGESVSTYLSQVRRSGLEVWNLLPDRPFFVIGAFDWQCPSEQAITTKFNEFVFFDDTQPTARKIPQDTRKRLREAMTSTQGQMQGSLFMATSPSGKLHPMQIYGGYVMDDARQGLESLVFLQENATTAMATFMGEPFFGKFERRAREGGSTLFEMKLDLDRTDPLMRRQLLDFYGEGVRIQETALDEHNIAYAVATPPAGVKDLMEARDSGRNLGRNEQVQATLARLPHDANAVVIVDLERSLSALPTWLKNSAPRATDGDRSSNWFDVSKGDERSVSSGRLLGWACTVQPNSFTGRATIGADDAVEVFKLMKKMAEGLARELDYPARSPAGRLLR